MRAFRFLIFIGKAALSGLARGNGDPNTATFLLGLAGDASCALGLSNSCTALAYDDETG